MQTRQGKKGCCAVRLEDQFVEFIAEKIAQYGRGYDMAGTEIRYEMSIRYGRKLSSILPSDYCYNRENGSLLCKLPRLFEYVSRNKYRLLGQGFPYLGPIYHKPIGQEERIIGEWTNGKRGLFHKGENQGCKTGMQGT